MQHFEENIPDGLNQNNSSEQSQQFDIKKEIFSWVEAIVVSIIVVSLVLTFVFRFAQVDGSSMLPTLVDEERLIISNLFYKPDRQDIVVVSRKNDIPLVKRIIGIEGDEIDIDFERGVVYVNGIALEEDYINAKTTLQSDVTFPVVVPKDHIFVMGDNRNASLDSRDSRVGMISEDNIYGRVVFRLFPFDKIGVVR